MYKRQVRRNRLALVGFTVASILAAMSTAPAAAENGPDVSSWQHIDGTAINWFAVRGAGHQFAMLKATEGLRQASDGSFAEYYEPFTGAPLGSMQQSWTAAAVLDWLG